MQTLIPPWPIVFAPASPSCEQVVPGNDSGEDEDGKIGTKTEAGAEQQPLQGESDGVGGDGTTQHNE